MGVDSNKFAPIRVNSHLYVVNLRWFGLGYLKMSFDELKKVAGLVIADYFQGLSNRSIRHISPNSIL